MDERPGALRLAMRLLRALLLAGAVSVLLMVLRTDDLVRAWAEGNPATRDVLREQGLEAVKDGSVTPPHFVPVAITLFVTLALLLGVLGVFVSNGFEWSRIGMTLVIFFSGVAGIAAIRTDPPALFTGCIVVCTALGLGLLACLWHPSTSAYIHADPYDDSPVDRPADRAAAGS